MYANLSLILKIARRNATIFYLICKDSQCAYNGIFSTEYELAHFFSACIRKLIHGVLITAEIYAQYCTTKEHISGTDSEYSALLRINFIVRMPFKTKN
jgi:hypothetical protein